MSPTLKVIGLISGGKDSLFNLLHCVHHGHEIVALANLQPLSKEGTDSVTTSESGDIDSYMYQTVGHSIVPLYEEALDLPLYRQEIFGKAVQTAVEYKYTSDTHDEVEDLYSLLLEIQGCHPEANAVCSGAILSNYQRNRVESATRALQLIPLSYLWQYTILGRPAGASNSVTGLLDDMASVGCEARIIKVASGGLDEDFLWADVCDPHVRQKLVRQMARFVDAKEDHNAVLKGAVLGEGGEYETLALSGPWPLWKHDIQVDAKYRLNVHGEGGTSSLAISQAKLLPLNSLQLPDQFTLPIPPLLCTTFSHIQTSFSPSLASARASGSNAKNAYPFPISKPSVFHHTPSSIFYISNLLSPIPNQPVNTQVQSLLDCFTHLLNTHSPPLSPTSILHTTILLRSMSLFPLLNSLYGKLELSDPLPPSRVTISVGDTLPTGHDLSMSFVISTNTTVSRKGLHVQSRSYWAPANIGPYSQAISRPFSSSSGGVEGGELIYLAGQIPLVPATMEPLSPEEPFIKHALLALQHLWRVGRATGVQWWVGGGVAYLAKCVKAKELRERVAAVRWAWRSVHQGRGRRVPGGEEDDDDDEGDNAEGDLWDQRFNRVLPRPVINDSKVEEEDEERLPNWSVVEQRTPGTEDDDLVPPLFILEVESLPRACLVEWSSIGLSFPATQSNPNSKVRIRTTHGPGFSCSTTSTVPSPSAHPSTTTPNSAPAALSFTALTFHAKTSLPILNSSDSPSNPSSTLLQNLNTATLDANISISSSTAVAHVTAFIPTSSSSSSSSSSSLSDLANTVEQKWPGRVQVVPGYSLWNGGGVEGGEGEDREDGEGEGEVVLGLVIRCENSGAEEEEEVKGTGTGTGDS